MPRNLVHLALLLVAACAPSGQTPANANRSQPTLITPLMLEPPPVYALLGYRERLELTSQQITSLDSIATQAHEQNQPLLQELREKATPTRNQSALVVGEEHRSLLQRIRDNNRRAAEAVGAVLTPTQEEATCRLFQEQREEREEGLREAREAREQRSGREARRRTRAEAADTTLMLERSIWPFCKTPAPATPPR